MRILFLCDEYPPCKHGGIGSVTQVLARELVKKDHQVFVCGFYPYERKALPFEVERGIEVHRHFYGTWLLLKLSRNKYLGRVVNIRSSFNAYIRFLQRFIKDKAINIIEIPDFNEVFRYSGPRMIGFPDFGIPRIVKCHGTYTFVNSTGTIRSRNNYLFTKEKNHIHSADRVIAVSNFAGKAVEEIFDYKKGIDIIHNGLSLSHTLTYKEDPDKKTVVFTGTLSENKGIYSLLRAWETVIKKVPEARLQIYGKASERTLNSLNDLITDFVKPSVEFKGYIEREELMQIYCKSSCAIFPSYNEAFGMTAIESMSVGCPTIFTRRSTGNEIIIDGYDGMLVDPDNIREISDVLIFMLMDRVAAVSMGKNAAVKVKEKFNISNIAEQHIRLYESILE